MHADEAKAKLASAKKSSRPRRERWTRRSAGLAHAARRHRAAPAALRAGARSAGRALGFLEVHSENFFADGGAALAVLRRRARAIRSACTASASRSARPPGSTPGTWTGWSAWCERIEPVRVSDHASFARARGATATRVHRQRPAADRLHRSRARHPRGQRRGGCRTGCAGRSWSRTCRPICAVPTTRSTEPAFFDALARRTGCGLLLDVNNLIVNALNAGVEPCARPATGSTRCRRHASARSTSPATDDAASSSIDDHGSRVRADGVAAVEHALARFGARADARRMGHRAAGARGAARRGARGGAAGGVRRLDVMTSAITVSRRCKTVVRALLREARPASLHGWLVEDASRRSTRLAGPCEPRRRRGRACSVGRAFRPCARCSAKRPSPPCRARTGSATACARRPVLARRGPARVRRRERGSSKASLSRRLRRLDRLVACAEVAADASFEPDTWRCSRRTSRPILALEPAAGQRAARLALSGGEHPPRA